MNNQPPKLDLKQASPLFEGFTLQMIKPGQQRKAKAAVTRLLGTAWQVKAFGDSGADFEVPVRQRKGMRYQLVGHGKKRIACAQSLA